MVTTIPNVLSNSTDFGEFKLLALLRYPYTSECEIYYVSITSTLTSWWPSFYL